MRGGEARDDPRLERVDVATRVGRRTIRVFDALEHPTSPVDLAWGESDGGRVGPDQSRRPSEPGWHLAIRHVDGMPIRLLVRLGRAPISLPNAKDGAEIRLELEKSD